VESEDGERDKAVSLSLSLSLYSIIQQKKLLSTMNRNQNFKTLDERKQELANLKAE